MGWISVKERLPTDKNPVFISDDAGLTIGYYDFLKREWRNFLCLEYPAKGVTHWMPVIFPQYPEGEK